MKAYCVICIQLVVYLSTLSKYTCKYSTSAYHHQLLLSRPPFSSAFLSFSLQLRLISACNFGDLLGLAANSGNAILIGVRITNYLYTLDSVTADCDNENTDNSTHGILVKQLPKKFKLSKVYAIYVMHNNNISICIAYFFSVNI